MVLHMIVHISSFAKYERKKQNSAALEIDACEVSSENLLNMSWGEE